MEFMYSGESAKEFLKQRGLRVDQLNDDFTKKHIDDEGFTITSSRLEGYIDDVVLVPYGSDFDITGSGIIPIEDLPLEDQVKRIIAFLKMKRLV